MSATCVMSASTLDSSPDSELDCGAVFDRYLIESKLGAGAMGTVYAAHDPKLDRALALKLIARRGGVRDRDRERMRREARALAKLNHPNVVSIYDVGVHDGRVFVAMEFVEGRTLTQWLDARPQPWRAVLPIFMAAGEGLAAAHEAGLVHRDFKPDNVMLGDDGRVRVMDFGLARLDDAPVDEDAGEGEAEAASFDSGADARLTASGAMVGTPVYMAPEQFRGRPRGAASSDQFGFCVALYEALYGRRPFAGADLRELRAAILGGELLPPPPGVRAPRWLQAIVVRGLASEPEQRFASMRALLCALEQGQRRQRGRRALASLAAIAGLVSGALGLAQLDRRADARACVAEGATIEEVWTPAIGARVQARLRASSLAHAADSAARVTPWLDAQAQAWRAHAIEVCARARADERWSGALADKAGWCLEDRRVELQSLITELEGATDVGMHAVIEAAANLSPIEACVDARSLASSPPPPSEAQREELRALHATLWRASHLGTLADHATALALAQEVRAAAEGLGAEPLVARAELVEGSQLARLAELPEAERAMQAAHDDAATSGDWSLAASAAMQLADVTTRVGRYRAAQTWMTISEAAIARAGDPRGLQTSILLELRANLDYDRGRPERGLEPLRRAIEQSQAALGPEHLRVANLEHMLATQLDAAGQRGPARALLDELVGEFEANFGAEHPMTASVLHNLASNMGAEEYEQAQRQYARAIAIYEASFGTAHPPVLESRYALATLHLRAGHPDRALAILAPAVVEAEAVLGPEHPSLARYLNNLAIVHRDLGDDAAARAAFERAIAIRIAVDGPDSLTLLSSLWGSIELARARGDDAEALARAEDLLRIIAPYPDRADDRAEFQQLAAELLWEAPVELGRDRARALQLARAAGRHFAGDPQRFEANQRQLDAWLRERADAIAELELREGP